MIYFFQVPDLAYFGRILGSVLSSVKKKGNEMKLILASSSPHKIKLLDDCGLRFTVKKPNTKEARFENESPTDMSIRLGTEKAQSVAKTLGESSRWLVLGSDQIAHKNNSIYHKPGDKFSAAKQLSELSGGSLQFTTSLVIADKSKVLFCGTDTFTIAFNILHLDLINEYLDLEKPFDCAGSIKVEKAGKLLLSGTEGRDISTAIGFPVMLLRDALSQLGFSIFNFITYPQDVVI